MHFIIWPANNSRHYFISPVRNAGRLGLGGWVPVECRGRSGRYVAATSRGVSVKDPAGQDY